MGSYDVDSISAHNVRTDMFRIFDLYRDFFVRDGVLVEAPPGLKVCGRDKDRGWSWKRVEALINAIWE